MLVESDRNRLSASNNITPVSSPRIVKGLLRSALVSSPKTGVVKKSATENSQLHKKQSYRNVGRYSGSFSPPGIFIDSIFSGSQEINPFRGDNNDVRLLYDMTTIKEMEGGGLLQHPSTGAGERRLGAMEARGERRPGLRDRLFTPQLPRRDPPPALARHRYDSPILGGTKRITHTRHSLDQLFVGWNM